MMKFGKFRNANRIVQRYRCVRCTKTFSEAQPLDGLRVDFKQACQVANMLCEGIGIRAFGAWQNASNGGGPDQPYLDSCTIT